MLFRKLNTCPKKPRLSARRSTSLSRAPSRVEDPYRVYDSVFENPSKSGQVEAYAIFANTAGRDTAISPGDELILPHVDRFLEADEEDQLPRALSERIRDICSSAKSTGSSSRAAHAPHPPEHRRAWLDDRECQTMGSLSHRSYQNPLNAEALHAGLQPRRWGNSDEPDADRRLM
jgi:hypothetical protein